MRRIAISILAAISLSACAHDSREASIATANDPTLLQLVEQGEQTNECKAFVRVSFNDGQDRYDCDEWLGQGTYHLTAWANYGNTVIPFAKFDDYASCAAQESSPPIMNMQAIAAPDGAGFYRVNEIWCVRHTN